MAPKIPLPDDDELEPEHREMLAGIPPLNVLSHDRRCTPGRAAVHGAR
ncbi:MAG TPA: hypothetical protein VKG38_07355 [Solirubrobacteraceae bacterium]|nr:hypothetical protein [Solirubrobacteraceae bacterium]